MTLEDAIFQLETFLKEIQGDYKPIHKTILSQEYLDALIKISNHWTKRVQTKADHLKSELNEEQTKLFDQNASKIIYDYSYILKSILDKTEANEIDE
jgi:tRNA(Phe) wybutosine-synthesizing methylase Tyw3